MDEYEDIINLPHHVSKRHSQMSMLSRAAQFAPFAALTGYDAALSEEERLSEEWMGPSDSEYGELNRTLQVVLAQIDEHPFVRVKYFRPDGHKLGGSYQECVGRVKHIDLKKRLLFLMDGSGMPLDCIDNITLEG
ncbi:MAG: YolD-like family protein [Bacteroidaceae bacterium]|nr:YolD-like family protein [Bacteroidaceae bacterium]